jgi:transglutaminase-like putative cysteine protease
MARASFRVKQEYRYSYPSPITDLRQRLIMLPNELHGGQRLLDRELTVRGADDMRMLSQHDRFGNVVHHVSGSRVLDAVEFTAEFTVERYATTIPLRLSASDDLTPYRAFTALTAPCARIREAARLLAAEIAATPIEELAEEMVPGGGADLDAGAIREWAAARCGGEWAARSITYQHGATGVQTPAAMALHLGRGVCQDYAHLAISILRELEVPVRYVSGHLLGEGAPHAWIETLLPDPDAAGQRRVVAYDPTHRCTPSLNYITVAVGRDYSDIAPTSGTFQGASGHFTARKNAWIVDLA